MDQIGQRWDTDWATLTSGQSQPMEGDGAGLALSLPPPHCLQPGSQSALQIQPQRSQGPPPAMD